MIRTHRPRGHAWNCASVFQQTLEFRHIDLDECQPPDEEILGDDPQDDWTLAERASKRQRIEKLADNFLNGFELHIHSARLDPQRFRTALALSFPRPRDAKAALDEVEADEESTETWEDVDDDREILRSLIAARSGTDDSTTVFADDSAASIERTVISEVQAQASCGPRRSLRSGRVLAGPSEDALRKAAELRNRRLKKPALDESQPQSCPRPVIPETQDQPIDSSLCETASDCGPTPTPAWTSSKWIKSGAFQMRKKGVDEDCSKDELGASSMFTPSQRSRTRSRPLGRVPSTEQSEVQVDAHPISSTATTAIESLTMRETDGESFRSTAFVPETSAQSLTVSSALADPSDNHTTGENDDDEDSQSRLLRDQGVYAAPRRSWVAVNDPPHSNTDNPEEAGQEPRNSSLAAQPTRKPSRGRKAKSTGQAETTGVQSKASPRRRSAPHDSQARADGDPELVSDQRVNGLRSRSQYTAVAVNGASPFVFRKRGSKSNATETPQSEPLPAVPDVVLPSKTPRRRVNFPSSDGPRQEPTSAPTPHTPLTNEHLNKILPRSSTSGRRSSATKRALRDELKASGAEMSRCADDPSSSQGEATTQEQESHMLAEDAADEAAPSELLARAQVESQPPWPGTQDQLAQAYKNLFTSPDKADTTMYLGGKSTPGSANDTSRAGRKPLKQLSQEPMPMPSTQALLDGWEGWSTIKKPRTGGKRPSLVQSPTVGKGQMMISSDPAHQSMEAANRRRSSLRYSMSTSDSPDKSNPKDINSLPTPKLDPTHVERDSSGFAKPAPRRSSAGVNSSLSFGFSTLDLPTSAGEQKQSDPLSKTFDDLSFGQTMSSVAQNAQRQPELDSQELDLTITQIAEDVLRTGVEDFMSQSHGGSL